VNRVLPIPLRTTREFSVGMRKRDRVRAERIRLAGSQTPMLRERAVALCSAKNGEARTKDLIEIRISRCYLTHVQRRLSR
jgi:hypothetical protein